MSKGRSTMKYPLRNLLIILFGIAVFVSAYAFSQMIISKDSMAVRSKANELPKEVLLKPDGKCVLSISAVQQSDFFQKDCKYQPGYESFRIRCASGAPADNFHYRDDRIFCYAEDGVYYTCSTPIDTVMRKRACLSEADVQSYASKICGCSNAPIIRIDDPTPPNR